MLLPYVLLVEVEKWEFYVSLVVDRSIHHHTLDHSNYHYAQFVGSVAVGCKIVGNVELLLYHHSFPHNLHQGLEFLLHEYVEKTYAYGQLPEGIDIARGNDCLDD